MVGLKGAVTTNDQSNDGLFLEPKMIRNALEKLEMILYIVEQSCLRGI